MNIEIISKIANIEDFKILIEEVINKSKIDLYKNTFDAGVLNFDKKQLISYFENKRQKLINKIKKNSFTFRVEFVDQNILINKDDYQQLFIFPTHVYSYIEQIKWNEEDATKEKKELTSYYMKRLKDIENSILIAFYNSKIEELKGGLNSNYKSLIFDRKESEEFFNYLVEKWLTKETHKVSALRLVFSEMNYKNIDTDTPYKITCTQSYFAREYWNKNFKDILKLQNTKNSKLNEEPTSNYYLNRFKELLDEF
jgi:hypothetical protein